MPNQTDPFNRRLRTGSRRAIPEVMFAQDGHDPIVKRRKPPPKQTGIASREADTREHPPQNPLNLVTEPLDHRSLRGRY
jgi:hypothetical protein